MKDSDNETTIYTLNNFLLDPPSFGIFNEDQTKCIITSRKDILFVDIQTGLEVDIDEQENISDILNIVGDDKYFYVLANKKDQLLGYYLLMVDIENPEKPANYLINWTNKCGISSVDLHFLEDAYDDDFDDDPTKEAEMRKYLVVSYKAEGINTYNVFVFDIVTKLIRFWHESYQLYE